MSQSIHLHIDHLVLDGITVRHDQHHQLQHSIEGELRRLLAEQGIRRQFSHHLASTSASMTLHDSRDVQQLGTHIARSIYQGMNS
jgi:hypothetical protein